MPIVFLLYIINYGDQILIKLPYIGYFWHFFLLFMQSLCVVVYRVYLFDISIPYWHILDNQTSPSKYQY